MRAKYVELVKEYIKLKPEYKLTLDKIKDEVSLVGVSDDEFEEAIRQLEGGSGNKKIIFKQSIIVGTIFAVLLFIIGTAFLNPFAPKTNKNKLASQNVIEKKQKEIFPVVYANDSPINAKAVFSIPSDNVKLSITSKPKKEVLGFFPYWMLEEQEKVSLNALTSISLFGLEINNKGEIMKSTAEGDIDPGWLMWKDENLDALILRAKNKGLKVYLTLKCFNNTNIEAISLSDAAQKALIANASYFIQSKNLNGVNLDFEYTGETNSRVRDGFTRLVKNLNEELKRQDENSVLTIDTYLVSGSEKGLFDLQNLAANTDAFVIMGYDMHTPNGTPGPVSAMGGDVNIIGYVQNYLEKIGPDKLILAVPYYGYDWPVNKTEGDKIDTLPYVEINEASKNLSLSWDDNSQTPYYEYADNGTRRIVHFDNVRSLGIKYDFINQKNLKGVGVWALGYDGLNSDLQKLLADKFIY